MSNEKIQRSRRLDTRVRKYKSSKAWRATKPKRSLRRSKGWMPRCRAKSRTAKSGSPAKSETTSKRSSNFCAARISASASVSKTLETSGRFRGRFWNFNHRFHGFNGSGKEIFGAFLLGRPWYGERLAALDGWHQRDRISWLNYVIALYPLGSGGN